MASLLDMLPPDCRSVLDIGARDGFITRLLADRIPKVTALDLEKPGIDDPRIACVAGDVTRLEFPDTSFDLVFCAEVLEHIPTTLLAQACRELARVARRHVLIGVPFKQDLRKGRMRCRTCGGINPPWGHVNAFDESRLRQLFSPLQAARTEFVGTSSPDTNALSAWLMRWAGYPYGTYSQQEPCIHCNSRMQAPARRTLAQRCFTRAAVISERLWSPMAGTHANWIHVLWAR